MIHVLLFYTVYGGGFFAALFRSPVYAFVLYEAVYFFNPQLRWWGGMIPSLSYSLLVVLLIMGVFVLSYSEAKKNRLLQIPQFRWMYFLVFLYAIADFYAVYPDSHHNALINLIKMIIIISIAYKLCDTAAKLDYVLYGYLFGAWYISFFAFQTGRNSGDRLEGIGTVDAPDANDVAAAIAPALVLSLYYFWMSPKWWGKALAAIAGVFVANGIILINSRGAFLGVIASVGLFMIYMYFSSVQRKSQKIVAVFILVAGLGGASMLVDESTIARFNSMSETEVDEDEETGATRTQYWISAWAMAKDHPFGAGHLGFNYYAPVYLPQDLNTGRSRSRAVHSSWFEALSEIGYLGMIAFIMMIYCTYRTMGLCKKELRKTGQVDEYFKIVAIGAALLAFLIAMSFINRMRAEILYWFVLYSGCAYNIYVLKVRAARVESEQTDSLTRRD